MQPSLFDNLNTTSVRESDVDYHILPATEKQQRFARQIAERSNAELPSDILGDRQKLSAWIDAHKAKREENKYARYPSSKQVRFAETISRRKRNPIPHECFRDKALMSRWIDSNR